jgi:hypothetical protein
MRDHTDLDFLDVFTPSANLERELGWDMQIRNLKGVVFQYKRPKISKNGSRRFSVRYSDQDYPRQLDQMKNWDKRFNGDPAYYALPLISEHGSLDETLMRTLFVHATAIPDNTSVIHIPEDYCYDGKRQSRESLEVYCSTPGNTDNNWTNVISVANVYGWKKLYKKIKECKIGFKIRYQNESWRDQYYPNWDETRSEGYTQEERLGLGKERGPYVTRFGSGDDSVFA